MQRTCVVIPVETVHNEVGWFKKNWISIKCIAMQITSIVIDDQGGCWNEKNRWYHCIFYMILWCFNVIRVH